MAHVVGIAEIVLWTADKERALAFYRDLLGLELISPPSLRNAFLKVGEGAAGVPAMVVLVPKGPDLLTQPSGYQLHHLALGLPPEASDTQQAALVAAGYTPRGRKHLVLASRKVDVGDPDGNEVKFICAEPSTLGDAAKRVPRRVQTLLVAATV